LRLGGAVQVKIGIGCIFKRRLQDVQHGGKL
jgi:hypothetical protein